MPDKIVWYKIAGSPRAGWALSTGRADVTAWVRIGKHTERAGKKKRSTRFRRAHRGQPTTYLSGTVYRATPLYS